MAGSRNLRSRARRQADRGLPSPVPPSAREFPESALGISERPGKRPSGGSGSDNDKRRELWFRYSDFQAQTVSRRRSLLSAKFRPKSSRQGNLGTTIHVPIGDEVGGYGARSRCDGKHEPAKLKPGDPRDSHRDVAHAFARAATRKAAVTTIACSFTASPYDRPSTRPGTARPEVCSEHPFR